MNIGTGKPRTQHRSVRAAGLGDGDSRKKAIVADKKRVAVSNNLAS